MGVDEFAEISQEEPRYQGKNFGRGGVEGRGQKNKRAAEYLQRACKYRRLFFKTKRGKAKRLLSLSQSAERWLLLLCLCFQLLRN